MVYGNLLSLTIYTILVLLTAIFTGSGILFIVSFINIILLIYQYNKSKKKNEENIKNTARVIERKIETADLKNQAKENIESRYKDIDLNDEEKQKLIRKEFVRLMIERK